MSINVKAAIGEISREVTLPDIVETLRVSTSIRFWPAIALAVDEDDLDMEHERIIGEFLIGVLRRADPGALFNLLGGDGDWPPTHVGLTTHVSHGTPPF